MVVTTLQLKSGGTCLFLGLSKLNVEHLQSERLIRLRQETHKIDLSQGFVEVVIAYADEELDFLEKFKDIIGPGTQLHVDPRLRKPTP